MSDEEKLPTSLSPSTPESLTEGELPRTSAQGRLRGTLIEGSRLRGSLVEKHQSALGTEEPKSTESKLRGSLITKLGEEAIEEPSLYPDDYKIDSVTAGLVKKRIDAYKSQERPLTDPDAIVTPGMLLSKDNDPDYRRLVTDIFTSAQGTLCAGIQIEGSMGVLNMPLDEIHQRIASGSLTPINPA